jgi:hypothetical protein
MLSSHLDKSMKLFAQQQVPKFNTVMLEKWWHTCDYHKRKMEQDDPVG